MSQYQTPLARYAASRPMPKPAAPADNVLQRILRDYIARQGQGGPGPIDPQVEAGNQAMQRNLQLRALMQQTDPQHFQSLVQRGFDQVQPVEPASIGAPPADFIPDGSNPALQMPNYTVSAEAQPVDLSQQRHNDLLWRSWNSARGQAQQAANVRNNTALQRRIAQLQNSVMPAETGDGNFSYRQRLMNALLWSTGQGGGMR